MQRYASLRQGLVGCWCPSVSGPFGYRLPDLSGYGNHGTLTNMDPGTDWVTSGGKGALDFDGSNDYVAADRPMSFSGDCTWLCWFRHTATGGDQCLLSTRNINTGANRNGVALYLRGSSLQNVQSEFVLNGTRYTADLASTTNDGMWRIAVSRRISGRTYLDVIGIGQAQSSSTSTATISHEVGVTLGLWRDYSTAAFSVQLDDIRIYNRALSESEIRLLASGRGVGLIPERQRNRYQVPPQQPRNRSSRFLSFPA